MNRVFSVILIGLFSFCFTACEEKPGNRINDEVNFISYGTSFGECLGYCIKRINVSDSQIDFSKRGWDLDGELPEVKVTEEISLEEWNELWNLIDYSKFIQLDSIIGCPDCADGGAEWIEISKDNVAQKVTFEYNNEPALLTGIIEMLRDYMADFPDEAN